jgi:uncharacterized protein (TIGR03083 family)
LTIEPETRSAPLVRVADDQWRRLAADAYQRLADDFAAVPDDAWDRPTPCTGWTVRDLGGHLVGAMRSAARLRETASQMAAATRRSKRNGTQVVDELTAEQIARALDLSPSEVVAELQSLVGPAVAGRFRLPAAVARRAGFRVQVGDIDERWSLAYFNGCILTRDAWLHRVDLADALGTRLSLDEHDRAIIGDVAVEWADRHGRPVSLHLTGPAGGRLERGDGADRIELDAVELCRVLSGRSTHPHPLLATQVPF